MIKLLLSVVLLGTLLNGCGLKGPLYQPTEQAQKTAQMTLISTSTNDNEIT